MISRASLEIVRDFNADMGFRARGKYATPFIYIIGWSQACGCFPVAYCPKIGLWRESKRIIFWICCCIGLNIPTCYNCMITTIQNDNNITLYVMILIVGVMSISAVSTHVLCIIHRKQWTLFLNNWMHFERRYPTLTVGVYSKRLLIPLFVGCITCTIFFIVNILNELRFNLIIEDGAVRMLALVYVYVIYSFTLATPILWIVMASKIICLCLVHVRQQLESIMQCLSYGFRCTTSPIQKCIATGDMNRLRQAVIELSRLIEMFKTIMGPFMLVIIPHHIVSLICFLYWTTVSLLDYSDWYYLLSFGLLSAQAIIPIFVGAIYSEDIESQKRALIEPLIVLKGTIFEETAKHEMATLIEHLDRLDAQIEARGFFKLNKGMATSVVNTVVTYLVVLMQFS